MDLNLIVRGFVHASGERSSLVVDRRTGLPVYAANLYLTCRVRNASQSHASVAAYAGCLVVLFRFCDEFGLELSERFRSQRFLESHELENFRNYCTYNFDRLAGYADITVDPLRLVIKDRRRVEGATLHRRLSVAADFLRWWARQHLAPQEREPEALRNMIDFLLNSRPSPKGRNAGLIDRAFSEQQFHCLLETVEIDSSKNPFEFSVRRRNRLMILIEAALGLRGGELLNLRIADFDFSNNKLTIVRRADQADDTRATQPLVKTLDREMVLANWLVGEVHQYILEDRRNVPGAKKCPYLFITYKSGPTQGQALSISAYKKIWKTLQLCDPLLSDASGHRLRHTWNNLHSELVDSLGLSEAEQEATRSRSMGWKEGSGTARVYNKRFTEKQAFKASVLLQNKMMGEKLK